MVARRSGPVPGHVAELLERITLHARQCSNLLIDLRYTLDHGATLEAHEARALAVTLSRIADASLAILDKRNEAPPPDPPPASAERHRWIPAVGAVRSPDKGRCSCGWGFGTREQWKSHAATPPASAERDAGAEAVIAPECRVYSEHHRCAGCACDCHDRAAEAVVQQALDRCEWADDGTGENAPVASSLLSWLRR